MASEAKTRQLTRADEDNLLLAVARGDVAALRDLYRAFEKPLFTLGMRWLQDAELAGELVQEVTVRIWRRASAFDPARGASSSWIFGIARNVAADLARTRGKNPIPVAEPRSGEAEPWDQDSAWEGWQVAKALRTLPPEQQRAVELAYVQQYTHSEIAAELGIPLGTVKTRLYTGLKKLRSELIALGVLESEGVS
jgi:RNA polymerase sigma-70 factor (ECF subfamily)